MMDNDEKYRRAYMRAAAANINETTLTRRRAARGFGGYLFLVTLLLGWGFVEWYFP